MLNAGVKFTHAKFSYYILQIHPYTQFQQIESKLREFGNIASGDKDIVLSFDKACPLEEVEVYTQRIKDMAVNFNLRLYAILANSVIADYTICQIPVIHLPDQQGECKMVHNKTLIVEEPVRSGMRIENDGDIIVTSFVSNGGEIVAGGNIHVYGEARGKLVAGNSGDSLARIFAFNFNPELIAISGVYRTIETKLPPNLLNHAVIVVLDKKQRLNIKALVAK